MRNIFTPNKTSARFLVEYANEKYHIDSEDVDSENLERYSLIYDLYIKARSYSIMNKIFFWIALTMGIVVLLWPSLEEVISRDFLHSAIVQTTVTGLAALAFAIYSHYKKRQTIVENLMRSAVHSEEAISLLKERIIKEMERIDTGFSFDESFSKVEEKKR